MGKIIKMTFPNDNGEIKAGDAGDRPSAKVIKVDPRACAEDTFTHIIARDHAARVDERVHGDNRDAELFRRAQQRSLRQDEAKVKREKKRKNVKTLVELTLLLITLIAIIVGLVVFNRKYPEDPALNGNGKGNMDSESPEDMDVAGINKKIEEYANKVAAIISKGKSDAGMPFNNIVDGLTNYLLEATSDELEYRAAVLAITRKANKTLCYEFLNAVFKNLSSNKTVPIGDGVSNFDEYLSKLNYSSFEEYILKEPDKLKELLESHGLSATQSKIAMALASGRITYDFKPGARR